MGFFTVDKDEIRELIRRNFGDNDNYVIGIKKNSKFSNGLLKFLLSSSINVLDTAKNYILVFNEDGIYGREIERDLDKKFNFIPWNEVKNIQCKDELDYSIIMINCIDNAYVYEIPYNGTLVKGNLDRLNRIIENKWYKN